MRLLTLDLGLCQMAPVSVVLVLALLLGACSPSVELLSDIPEAEVNEVLSALTAAGIAAKKTSGKEGLASISVDKNQIGRAIAKLSAEGLPHERFAKMGEVFRKEGLISSPLEERARYLWALSQELSSTVSQIDGVLKARVHVVLPERSSGSDPAMPSSAAVFIKYRMGYSLDEASVQVKRLVANSIPGLTIDKVSVVLLPAMERTAKEEAFQAGAGVRVWGYPVAGESAAGLRALLTGMLILTLCTTAACSVMAWKIWGAKWAARLKSATGKDRSNTGEGL